MVRAMPEWFVVGGIILIACIVVAIGITIQNCYDEYMEGRDW